MALLVLEAVWGIVLAGVCCWIASQGSTVRGVLAVLVALLVVTICAVIISVYYASLSTVRKAVTGAALGRQILDALFDRVLGISGEDTGEASDSSLVPTHLSRDEVKQMLNKAASAILSDQPPKSTLAGPFYWLAKQIQRVAIWATVRVIVGACSLDGTSVNMYELRDRLAATIDDGVVSYLNDYFRRMALIVILVGSVISMLLSLAIREIPW